MNSWNPIYPILQPCAQLLQAPLKASSSAPTSSPQIQVHRRNHTNLEDHPGSSGMFYLHDCQQHHSQLLLVLRAGDTWDRKAARQGYQADL